VYSYPPARMGGDVDDYHGELIADPYRWLETTTDAETVSWIKAENELTESFLAAVPARESIREQLTGLWDYPRVGVPFERGGRWFQSRNPGLAAQPVLYVMDQPGETGRVLLDPNTRSAAGTTAVSAVSVSDDGMLLAYATSDGGSDWLTWRVRDVATGEDLAYVIEWSKFSGAAEYLEANAPSRILFHRIGTLQDSDEVVFAAPDEPDWMAYAEVTEDGRFLVVTIERAAGFETRLHVLDLRDPAAQLRPLIGDFESVNVVVTSVGTTFYLVTDHDAERKRLVAADLESPGPGELARGHRRR
jgi:prolyl oligopeptidase